MNNIPAHLHAQAQDRMLRKPADCATIQLQRDDTLDSKLASLLESKQDFHIATAREDEDGA